MIRTRIERTDKLGKMKSVLFTVPLVAGVMASEPSFAKPANPKNGIVNTDIEGHALKSFDKATQGLGALSKESKEALAKIGQMVAAVVSGKKVAVDEEEECVDCLRKKGEVNPLTGEISNESEEAVLSEYQFSVGDKKRAAAFAKTLREELRGVKDVKVMSEGEVVVVRNTNKRETIAFE